MNIKQRLIMLVLPAIILMSGTSTAAIVMPALDIQDFGADTGIDLTATAFNIDATAFTIVTTGDPIDIADVPFILQSSGVYEYDAATSTGSGSFSGSFTVGTLLTGTFTSLGLGSFSATDGQFFADVVYTGGSLQGNLTGGRIEGSFDSTGMVAKLGNVAVVPVPAAAWLFGSGLIGLIGIARKKA